MGETEVRWVVLDMFLRWLMCPRDMHVSMTSRVISFIAIKTESISSDSYRHVRRMSRMKASDADIWKKIVKAEFAILEALNYKVVLKTWRYWVGVVSQAVYGKNIESRDACIAGVDAIMQMMWQNVEFWTSYLRVDIAVVLVAVMYCCESREGTPRVSPIRGGCWSTERRQCAWWLGIVYDAGVGKATGIGMMRQVVDWADRLRKEHQWEPSDLAPLIVMRELLKLIHV